MSLKVHVALNTPQFEQSVAFYRAFLGLEPVKLKPGYAKFDVADPPLNLTLNEGPAPTAGADDAMVSTRREAPVVRARKFSADAMASMVSSLPLCRSCRLVDNAMTELGARRHSSGHQAAFAPG